MTTFEKLQKKIRKELNIEADYFVRTRYKRDVLSAGAWSWTARVLDLKGEKTVYNIGSQFPASELIKSKYFLNCFLDGLDYHIAPELKGRKSGIIDGIGLCKNYIKNEKK